MVTVIPPVICVPSTKHQRITIYVTTYYILLDMSRRIDTHRRKGENYRRQRT